MKLKLFATAIAAVVMAAGSAYAQCPDQLCLPDGTPVKCTVDPSGTKVWVDLNGNPIPTNTQGTGDFKVVQCDCAASTLLLAPTDLKITSTNPAFGTITTYLDPDREAPPATVRDNGDGTYTEDFYFYVKADAPGLPTLTGNNVLHFQSKSVKTFNPHQKEAFTQVSPVEFIDDAGNVILTLQATQITLVP